MMVMYRTETYSGSGKRRFAHVLRFELFELGNSHIFDELIRVQDFYGGTDGDTEGYVTSDVVLLDLEHNGVLFGYELEPLPCWIKTNSEK